MSTDGGLYQLMKKKIRADWVRTESTMGEGVPDANVCLEGCDTWIEFKQTTGWKVGVRPSQVAWAKRRISHGGRVLFMVRQQNTVIADSRDVLWVIKGEGAETLATDGLKYFPSPMLLLVNENGPRKWEWDLINAILKGEAK